MPFQQKLEAWAFRVFGGIAPRLLKNVYPFKTNLEKARIKIYSEAYESLMLMAGLVTLPVSIIGALLLYFTHFIAFAILIAVPAIAMGMFILIPMSKASDRASALEREMPFASAYVSVMASGGIAPYSSFKRLSNVELMPSMRLESKEIIKDVEIFGIDPLTALEKSGKNNPLDVFKDFMSGYASTVIIGGDIGHYLERKAEDIFKARAMRVKAAAERLGMLLETFIIVMVMMSLCFYILFAVDNISSTGGTSMVSGILMYTFLFTPILSMVFIYLAHSMQPKTPMTEMRPYKVFGICSALGIALFLLLTDFMGVVQIPFLTSLHSIIDLPVAISIALFVATFPAALVQIRLARHKASMEAGISTFLRDLTEVRKTGLSPEKCIESLSKREYGAFSKEIRKISSEISWGIPIKRVMMDFLKRTKSWMTQIVMFLLVETIDVGGGTIAMIESLARFNNLTQEVDKEKKMSVRPYIMMPYLAAILLVATTVMMLGFTSGTLIAVPTVAGQVAAPTKDMSGITNIFITSVIFHSYIIGIVAGKISEESISSGFKHAAILVVIALVAAKVVPMFM
jgi:archaeal flagellar protein FlaJ